MRNPWGGTEWTEKWCDDDPNWKEVSNEEKKRIGYTDDEDGIFFIEYKEMLHYFDGV